MSLLAILALILVGTWWLSSVVLAGVIGWHAAPDRNAFVIAPAGLAGGFAAPVDTGPAGLSVADIDIALLQISVVPPAERTAEDREALDRLLDDRAALTLPRRQPSVPVVPGWSS